MATITSETILYPEEYWMNSQLSIARHYGGISVNGKMYIIVNKEGKDLIECSREAEAAGRDKAIEPGEPADLILFQWQPIYKALGREKFLEYIREHHDLDEAREYIKTLKNSPLTCS